MTNEKMFEMAVRTKMRFPFKGIISVEDLWDLSPENLDSIFKDLNFRLKQVKEESLLNTRTKQDQELDTKIEIVKYIVQVKLTEQDIKLKEKEKREKKQELLEILSTKQNEDVRSKSIEEIKGMIDALDN
ncbi:MAG: hypothetical protein JWM44_1532 [Bacilli bacterium]|nr:hypothetical protein [Bacilli bacterium]